MSWTITPLTPIHNGVKGSIMRFDPLQFNIPATDAKDKDVTIYSNLKPLAVPLKIHE